ncbi:MAG: carbamoyltransferase HypF [Desulfurococcales archaeon]|nr:carbamoyltransferase HypF [Desulfurococcales archaeon]
MPVKALRIRVVGLVQGVGFRPFIHRLAYRHGLRGYVVNLGGSEVEIYVEGESNRVDAFLRSLPEKKPPPAIIERLAVEEVKPIGIQDFEIRRSQKRVTQRSAIPPDLGICEHCLREILDPGDRRYRYPWNSCAWCGPRYSMMYTLPYDRENTSMRDFPLCENCLREYRNIGDERRYHAQGISCPVCGPKTFLLDSEGIPLHVRDPIGEAARLLEEGHVLAVKGMGGYHIASLASDTSVVRRVRRIKDRPSQPLAVMVRDCGKVREIAQASEEDCRILGSPQRPILLLPRREESFVDPLVTGGLYWIGVMLPYTGLHALLLREVGDGVLIMTSGNKHGFPMCRSLSCVLEQIGGEIDYILEHNREIVHRVDDSVVRRTRGHILQLRRSRGYAPYWITVEPVLPEAIALGAELQTAGGVSFENKIVLTQYIGDLDNPAQLSELQEEIEWLAKNYRLSPELIVYDKHPSYHNRRLVPLLAEKYGAETVEIQHHCAHALSLIADRGLPADQYYPAVVVDGAGYGDDGRVWGGESLVVGPGGCGRASHISYFPLPGGDAATREPIRILIGILSTVHGEDEVIGLLHDIGRIPAAISEEKARLVYKIAGASPKTSSAGRLADALSSLLGISYRRTYEGEPAITLESELLKHRIQPDRSLEPPLERGMLDPYHSVMSVYEKLRAGKHREALKIAATVLYWVGYTLASSALGRVSGDVLLSGGAAVNEYIAMGVEDAASENGVGVIYHRHLPPGDGGIAAGQLLSIALNK